MEPTTPLDGLPAENLASIAARGMGFRMHVAPDRGISDLLKIAKAARSGGAHVEMIGLADWPIEDIREIGLAAQGHVTAR